MKTTGKSIFKTTALILTVITFSSLASFGAQVQKTFSWKYPANSQTHIGLDNYNCDLVIHAWEKSETEFHLTVEATGKTPDDEARLVKFLENLKFPNSGSEISFRTSFWKERNTINGTTTIKTDGEKDMKFTEFNMKGELWLPAGNSFGLDSKYSRIDMSDFNGKLTLALYNDNFYGAGLTEPLEMTAKYANVEFKDLKGIRAELYNCTFEAGNIGVTELDSKYSKFNAKSSENVTVDSYNDKFTFSSTGDLKFSGKYSDITSPVSGKVTLDIYNGTITLNSSKSISLSSKYAEFRFDKTGDIRIGDSYNDKFDIGSVTSVTVDVSKYSNYKIDDLGQSLAEADGYNDNFMVAKTSSALKEITMTGKYNELTVGVPVSLNLRLKANIKYPTFEINEASFTTRTKISDDSGLQYDGVKGTEKDGMPVIDVKGYNMTLKIQDLK